MLDQTRYVGEIGLDYVTTDRILRQKQRQIFEAILKDCAAFGDKILTVHSRRAAADVIACIGGGFPGAVILHWFSGSKRELRAGLDAGCYFSVNPAMIKSERGRSLILEIPRTRLLTESDGPFVEVESRGAIPSDVLIAVEGIAQLWRVEPTEAATTILTNFRTLVDTSSA
jgi:TatD DNase family protein